jgi:hypothetical protein
MQKKSNLRRNPRFFAGYLPDMTLTAAVLSYQPTRQLPRVGDASITDGGLHHLAKCTSLTLLSLKGALVTDTGLARCVACIFT